VIRENKRNEVLKGVSQAEVVWDR